MDATAERVLEYLTGVEEAAEDVLSDKQQIVDLDRKRNANREALNALRNDLSGDGKAKVCLGNMFIKLPKDKTKQILEKDQEQLDKEISGLRDGLKVKVNRLNELQGKPELTGYNLCPLSNEEMKAISSILRT
ncbi:p53 and DNA damage-regulated protein 1 [Clupea harengus]|uniref:p53 and DNA damage-regulated protein 1 n=1 Tax=Clupea harengus TaxID=7950 RepID=A0A6P3WBQ0_CLUHA|nr:p53 and DNA damage-regulated protein 1 [Clupea harengus]